jgi:hypothetical protein
LSLLFSYERKQTDESGSQDRSADGSLVQGRCARSTARQNATFAVNQIAKSLHVFVVHVHWTWHFSAAGEHACQFLFLLRATLTELLQICSGNCCHETTYYLLRMHKLRAMNPVRPDR